jgi:hypothetical protein
MLVTNTVTGTAPLSLSACSSRTRRSSSDTLSPPGDPSCDRRETQRPRANTSAARRLNCGSIVERWVDRYEVISRLFTHLCRTIILERLTKGYA